MLTSLPFMASDPEVSFPLAGSRGRHHGRLYYNRRIALPMSLSIVLQRLQDPCYYRTSKALEHDLSTLVGNAESFNGPRHQIAANAKCVKEFVFNELRGEQERACNNNTANLSDGELMLR